MSTQPVSVAVIAEPGHERTGQYVVDGLQRRGKIARLTYSPSTNAESIPLGSKINIDDIDDIDTAVFLIEKQLMYRGTWLILSKALKEKLILPVFGLCLIDIDHENASRIIQGEFIYAYGLNLLDSAIDELNNRIDEAVAAQAGNQSQTQSAETYSCTFTDDSGTPVGTYTLTAALTSLLLRAQQLNEVKWVTAHEPDIAFTSLLLAYLTLDTPITQWFYRFIQRTGVKTELQLARLSHDTDTLSKVADVAISLPPTFSLWPSSSVRRIFTDAQIAASNISDNTTLDVRHIMAMFIYNPGTHTADYSAMNLDRQQWSNSFLGFISAYHPDEFELYRQKHEEEFKSPPEPIDGDISKPADFIEDESSGTSTHTITDLWTTTDTLGYDAYAEAIVQFLLHERTEPPLTISIQAPWGGGKTSLMRMIQKKLDPQALLRKSGDAVIGKKSGWIKRCIYKMQGMANCTKAMWPKARTVWSEGKEQPVVKRLVNIGREWKELWIKRTDSLTVRQVLQELKRQASGEKIALNLLEPDSKRQRLTVWFNAWKYESVNQVWAGLVDAILNQVTENMTTAGRELFWLQLHIRRVDADKIRKKIYDKVWTVAWRGVWWVALLVVSAGVGMLFLMFQGYIQAVGVALGISTATLLGVGLNVWKAFRKVRSEPADFSLSEYVSAPNYSAELGFVHHAEKDLQHVFKCISDNGKHISEKNPLVIFIDDLDRCTPGSVAKVMEAINSFLAGDFPHCIFILGMDSELVAAALQVAHKDMFAEISGQARTHIGWRFMDKFIQLPFVIPPSEPKNVKDYMAALFSQDKETIDRVQVVMKKLEGISDESVIEQKGQEDGLSTDEVIILKDQIQAVETRREIQRAANEFSDKKPKIRELIAQGVPYFRDNPRELKRFVNTFRFHYLLLHIRKKKAGDSNCPSLHQVMRWTILSMKWPELVRWLRWDSKLRDTEKLNIDRVEKVLDSRLGYLTLLADEHRSTSIREWKEAIESRYSADSFPRTVLQDVDLYRFFCEEVENDEEQRLSAGAGRGLW